LQSIDQVTQIGGWAKIEPNDQYDWINQRVEGFDKFFSLGDKRSDAGECLFETYSMGIKSNRDAWVYNFSKLQLAKNIRHTISTYRSEQSRLIGKTLEEIESGILRDGAAIKWTTDIIGALAKGKTFKLDEGDLVESIYRPFTKCWWYDSSSWNWTRHLMPRFFPRGVSDNLIIAVSGVGARAGFSALIMNRLPCLDVIEKGQCFPLKIYDTTPAREDGDLVERANRQGAVKFRSGITEAGLRHIQVGYPGQLIKAEDIFYYVYGLLHSEEYRSRFADSISKELPRIPRVKTAADFWAFSKAGRALGDLHINYEKAPIYPGAKVTHSNNKHDYRVEKMRYGGKGRGTDQDRTTLHYNDSITVTGIPLDAYEYVVNGKPALDWVVERQCVKTDKDSGIVNDANDWAIETMKNPKYPLELFLRVITVSLETMKIVKSLPKLDIHEKG
jgi:predicted helicase